MTLIDSDVDLEAMLQTANPPCITCCHVNQTFCGKPYHPEMSVKVEEVIAEDQSDACKECDEEVGEWCCDDGGTAPAHLHCPFRSGHPVCIIEAE